MLYSSSLSVLGSCIQKKNLRVDDLNFRIYALPVVHCFTRLYSISSGKMIRSWMERGNELNYCMANDAKLRFSCPGFMLYLSHFKFLFSLVSLFPFKLQYTEKSGHPRDPHSGFSLRILAGEQCKVTGELLCKSKALSGNERNLDSKFCVVAGEFSNLRCLITALINTLLASVR